MLLSLLRPLLGEIKHFHLCDAILASLRFLPSPHHHLLRRGIKRFRLNDVILISLRNLPSLLLLQRYELEYAADVIVALVFP